MSIDLANTVLHNVHRINWAGLKLLHRCFNEICEETSITTTCDQIGIDFADRNLTGRRLWVVLIVEPVDGLAQYGLIVGELLKKPNLSAGRHYGNPVIGCHSIFDKVK